MKNADYGMWSANSRCRLAGWAYIAPRTSYLVRCAANVLRLALALCILTNAGCATQKPVLYPNDHYKQVGEEQAEKDIEDCQAQAEKAGATPDTGKGKQVAKDTAVSTGIGAAAGAVGGAIVGSAGYGAAIGAASGAVWGLFGSMFRSSGPSEAHKGYVIRCMKDKGYDPTGYN